MKYLVTFATKGLDAAASFSTYGDAFLYLNDCIDAANVLIEDFGSYAPDCFKMVLIDGRDFNIRIERQNDIDVRYDLKIAKNERVVETRRFVSREYAKNFAHRFLLSKGYRSSALGDSEGFWAVKDDRNGDKYELGICLALLGGSKGSDYDVLGVSSSATAEEVKKAYRAKVKENHPDRGGDSAKFEKIQKAYERITKGQSSKVRFVKRYYDSRDMVQFFESYDLTERARPRGKPEHMGFDLETELNKARQQASSTAGGGAILLALGGAIIVFTLMSGDLYPLVLLAAAAVMGWGLFRLVCGMYYQSKIEKLVQKLKKH